MALDFTFERQLQLEVADARDEAREEGLAEGREAGLAEGLAEGRAEGRAEGAAEIKKITLLTQYLVKDQRIDDLTRSTQDEEFRNQLLVEYGIQ